MDKKGMKTTDYIAYTLQRMPKGYVFTYEDFMQGVGKKEAVIKALNRLVAAGKLNKLSKGKYYKPKETPFGELEPGEQQIVKDYLEKDGKIIGYLTGYSIYNRLGLSTQVSPIIQIGRASERPATERGKYKVVFVKQKNTITKSNIPLLQLLDAIKNIKKIPDAPLKQSLKRFAAIVKELSPESVQGLMRLALKYPPSTRALLGAIVNQVMPEMDTDILQQSLNPITRYKIGLDEKVLDNLNKWNIV
tara:strand:- start:18977 stop:19717 length:741 start_codon:yes stop_codon:yes gene_type:complete